MAPIKIIIVGGGMGGLAAAAGLASKGHSVTVFERSEAQGGVGFAFRITANADRCLRHLGIDTIAGGAHVVEEAINYDSQGVELRRNRENANGPQKGGALSTFAYRPQLQQQLWEKAVENGARIETGAKVEKIDTDKSDITLDDGRQIHADLIIGADGVNSLIRTHVVDESTLHPKPTYGRNCFRFMLQSDTACADPLLKDLPLRSSLVSWLEKGMGVISYPVDFGRQLNVACLHPEGLSDKVVMQSASVETITSYNQKVSAETAIGIYADYAPSCRRMLELADPEGFRIWKLRDMEELPRWSVQGSTNGHTLILGDAAHALLPYGFSGASMAIEDAIVLSELLAPEHIPEQQHADWLARLLERWEQIRKPRVNRVREGSRESGRGAWDKPKALAYLAFLQEYDAVDDARKNLRELLGEDA